MVRLYKVGTWTVNYSIEEILNAVDEINNPNDKQKLIQKKNKLKI